jgi:nucleotide-binding universal stress UspA family protein
MMCSKTHAAECGLTGRTRILLAYDARPCARHAYDSILRLPLIERQELAILAVIRPSALSVDYAAQTMLHYAAGELEEQLGQLERRAVFAGTACMTSIRLGEPAEQILLAARAWHPGLIVIGRRSRRWLPGWGRSIHKRLQAQAPCPVRIINSPSIPAR